MILGGSEVLKSPSKACEIFAASHRKKQQREISSINARRNQKFHS
jgi:hypothetical protein